MSFKEDVRTFLLLKGQCCSEGGWVWGWKGYWSPRDEGHSAGCHWVATDESEVVEYSFSEWQDSDSDNLQKTLLALTHVDCQCRKLMNVTIGVEGGTMTLLHELLGIKKEYR